MISTRTIAPVVQTVLPLTIKATVVGVLDLHKQV
jgi:hypothetical protein